MIWVTFGNLSFINGWACIIRFNLFNQVQFLSAAGLHTSLFQNFKKGELKKKEKSVIYPFMLMPFTQRVLQVIKSIPQGKVISYGRVAALAGNPRGARQVSRILHSMSAKHYLPWHRVVNCRGKISLPRGRGYELQRALLESEGVCFSPFHTIDLKKCLWQAPSD